MGSTLRATPFRFLHYAYSHNGDSTRGNIFTLGDTPSHTAAIDQTCQFRHLIHRYLREGEHHWTATTRMVFYCEARSMDVAWRPARCRLGYEGSGVLRAFDFRRRIRWPGALRRRFRRRTRLWCSAGLGSLISLFKKVYAAVTT